MGGLDENAKLLNGSLPADPFEGLVHVLPERQTGIHPVARAAPSIQPKPLLEIFTTRDLAEPLPPVPYVLTGLAIAPGAPILFSGFGDSKKTMSTHAAALATAAGKPWWGMFSSKKGRVALVDFEQGRRLTQERLQRLARGMGFEIGELGEDAIRTTHFPTVYLTDPRALDVYSRFFEGATIGVVDSLRAAAPDLEENSSEMRRPLDLLGQVSERTGCAIIVIHHNRKPSQNQPGGNRYAIRGSGGIFDACASVFVLSGEKNEPVRVSHEKDRCRGVPSDDFGLVVEDVTIGGDPRGGLRVRHLEAAQLDAPTDAQGPKLHATILNELAKGPFIGSKSALRDVVGGGTARFRAAFAEMETDGRVLVTHKGNRTIIELGSPTGVRPGSPNRTDWTIPRGESESNASEGDE